MAENFSSFNLCVRLNRWGLDWDGMTTNSLPSCDSDARANGRRLSRAATGGVGSSRLLAFYVSWCL